MTTNDGIDSIPLRWCNTHKSIYPFTGDFCAVRLDTLDNLQTDCEEYHLFLNPDTDKEK